MWRWSGSHTRRDASTSSTVVGLRNIAFGFSSPLVRFFTTTWASCSLVTPDSRISRCARNAKYAGVAASPACSRQGSKNDDRMMPLGIFSIPNTSTVSCWPARIALAASMSAAPPLAQPASTFTIGMPVRPSAPRTLWPAATPEYTVAQNAAWKSGSPASARAARTAVTPISVTVTSSNRPKGWSPVPAIATPLMS